MSAESWTTFWGAVLGGGVLGFSVLAVSVTVGGFRDVRAMFRRITEQHERES
jgi:hypothetical protein